MHVPRSHRVEVTEADKRPLVTLLRAYRDLLDHRPPAVIWMRRSRGLGRLVRVPCIRWIAQYFTSAHVRRSLTALERRYTARIALDEACATERAELERLKAFRVSLPPVLLAGVALTSAFTAFASIGLTGLGSALEVTGIVGKLQAAYESKIASSNTWAEELLLAVIVLPLALSVLLAPVVGAFRLKRARFNLHPELQAPAPRASEHAGRADGVYGLEREAFGRLGTAPPREFPVDLFASILPTVAIGSLLVAFVVIGVQSALDGYPTSAVAAGFWAAALVPLVLARLRRVVGFARARATGRAPAPVAAEPVRVRTRWRAQLVDLPAVVVFSAGLWVATALLFDGRDEEVLAWATPTIAGLAYALLFLAHGRPLGKSWADIEVLRADGEQAEWWRHVLREGILKWGLFGVPSLFMLGVPALLNLLWPYVDEHNRALHDVIAGTVVTRKEPNPKLAPALAPA
jgi:uncharacterized RDD family membrane protein YckC